MISLLDNCLFIHVPKVAGQSIESVFLERAGLIWQEREAFLLKHNKIPELGPPRLAHLTAQEYVEFGHLSLADFNRLFKFAFVRNPWDRLVSEYIYRKYPFSFKDFLLKHFPTIEDDNYEQGIDLYRHVIPQADFLCDKNGNLLVDYVGKFESLKQDFAEVTKIVTGQALTLPHKNKSSRKSIQKLLGLSKSKSRHYSHYYDDECINFVANKYKQDIDLFGYSFEQKE